MELQLQYKEKIKMVYYENLLVYVPEKTRFLAYCKHGILKAYPNRPEWNMDSWVGGCSTTIVKVECNDAEMSLLDLRMDYPDEGDDYYLVDVGSTNLHSKLTYTGTRTTKDLFRCMYNRGILYHNMTDCVAHTRRILSEIHKEEKLYEIE